LTNVETSLGKNGIDVPTALFKDFELFLAPEQYTGFKEEITANKSKRVKR